MSDQDAPSPIPPNPFKLQLPDGGELFVFSDPEMGSSELDLCDREGRIVNHDSPEVAGIAVHPIDAAAIWRVVAGGG
jgi:hypothetical protein